MRSATKSSSLTTGSFQSHPLLMARDSIPLCMNVLCIVCRMYSHYSVYAICVGHSWPLCANMTLSSKPVVPEVHNVSQHRINMVASNIVCGAGSIKRSDVRPYVHLSVSLSYQSNAAAGCGGFAAECRTRKRYRTTAPGARQQQHRSSPGPQHGAQQQMRAMLCGQPN